MLILNYHYAGFFACTSLRFFRIFDYFNDNKKLPEGIDSSRSYVQYRRHHNDGPDYSLLFFKDCKLVNKILELPHPITIVNSNVERQFTDYNNFNFDASQPIMEKYFSLTDTILEKVDILKEKYNIDFENTCGIFFRGNDKSTETTQPSYEDIVTKALELKNNNPNLRFVIQTDENEFLEYFISHIPDAFHFTEIPKIGKCKTSLQYQQFFTLEHQKYYVASVYLLSKCKFVVSTSGNGEMFMVLWRGNTKGLIQWCGDVFYSNVKQGFWIDNTKSN